MKNIFIGIICAAVLTASCEKNDVNQTVSEDAVLSLANAYYTNGLYEAAAGQYLDYLDQYHHDAARKANTYYTIANIYFDRLHDYEQALIFYFKVKYLYPESSLQAEVSKKIVNCLERLEKSSDAQRVLENESALDKEQIKENKPGQVVASIGDRNITQGDLDFEVSKLPDYVKQQFTDTKQKTEFLKQYILSELLYGSAKRQGLEKDKDVIEAAFRAKKTYMADKILQQEMQKKLKKIEPGDVDLYFKAHKDQYVEKDKDGKVKRQKSFYEVQQQVMQDLAREQQQKVYQELADRLMQAEDVKIFDSRIK